MDAKGDCFMIRIWLSSDFVLVILYMCSINVTLMSLFNIFSFCWFIWLLSIVFFSPSFSFCYHGTLKRVYETSNVSKNAFFKHFALGNNLIFNIIRLTFLASESLKLIQKTFHLKDISFHQFLIPTKRYLWKNFPRFVHRIHMNLIIFLNSADISNFFFHVWDNFTQERKFFNWVEVYVNNKGLTDFGFVTLYWKLLKYFFRKFRTNSW